MVTSGDSRLETVIVLLGRERERERLFNDITTTVCGIV